MNRGAVGAPLAAGAVVAIGLGTWIRIHNAFHYPIEMGFDAQGNWQYIQMLMESWSIPSADAGWSTAHPPLFYLGAALIGAGPAGGDKESTFLLTRLMSTLAGLMSIGLAVLLVRRVSPGDGRRALLAAIVVLFLPVHLYMSAMLSEEILTSFWISLVVFALAWESAGAPVRRPYRNDVAIGVAAGLALLTKLTGLLSIGVAALTLIALGWQQGKPTQGLARALRMLLVATLVGGWFYARNVVNRGFLYPHALEVHSVMFSMPPGERGLLDYVRIPMDTFTNPDLLSPALLHSVWGSTYVTLFFDGHQHFLPNHDSLAAILGSTLLVLGLVPCTAFVWGALRGTRRAWRSRGGPDLPLLLLVAATLAGYALFTWRNPWFVVLKGSFLLGLSVPFAYYASEVLAEWTDLGRGRLRAATVSILLVALVATATVTFSFDTLFRKSEYPGLEWTPIESIGVTP